MIDNVEFQKDLGIRFEIQLKFHSHTTEVACLLEVIRRSSDHLDLDMCVDYIIILLPWCVYHNSVWGSSFALDQRKIEKVQHRATRLLLPIRDKPYRKNSQYCSILLL